jgi:hypothetical protein
MPPRERPSACCSQRADGGLRCANPAVSQAPHGEERQRVRAQRGPMTGSAHLRTMLRIAGRTMRPRLWPASFETPASRGLLQDEGLNGCDAALKVREFVSHASRPRSGSLNHAYLGVRNAELQV